MVKLPSTTHVAEVDGSIESVRYPVVIVQCTVLIMPQDVDT